MKPNALRQIGELMYGPRWKTDMAKDLGVDRHTVIGYMDRLWTMPPERDKDIKALAAKRIAALRQAMKAINTRPSP